MIDHKVIIEPPSVRSILWNGLKAKLENINKEIFDQYVNLRIPNPNFKVHRK